MAQSVLEFLRIARKNDFHEIVISLKASNTRVMVYAYRLLMNKMIKEGMNYPLHLGVTEAGDGEDGRIKSAIGIGTLLADGIGDTVRVSLTEDPEFEVPVAKKIVANFTELSGHEDINGVDELTKDPFDYIKRETFNATKIGSESKAVVIADLSSNVSVVDADIIKLGYKLDNENGWQPADNSPDYIFTGEAIISTSTTHGLKFICEASEWFDKINVFPYYSDIKNFETGQTGSKMNFIRVQNTAETIDELKTLKDDTSIILLLESNVKNVVADQRAFMQHLINNNLKFPVILKRRYDIADNEDFQIKTACDIGPLLIDGYVEGIMISNIAEKNCMNIVNTSFAILQASRTRMTKTEYISCPSCGRTLFEIQKVTEKIKNRTGHLKGLKIAVMGCIVNGPGEMADADYGYVGAGAGKVSLYKGKEVIKKNIASENALDDLVQLIKDEGDWREPV
jgi:(E)-4-hydroxy-3-methylbut-2-enyl-diphosphate synthase